MKEVSVGKAVLVGALAGLAGSIAMNGVSRFWSVARDPRLHRQGGRPDVERAKKDPGHPIATEEVGAPAGIPGEWVHYAYGAATGAAYAAAARHWPMITVGLGVPFGLAIWASAVETALPLLRLMEPPTEYTPGEHAFSVVSHIAYGAVVEQTRRAILD